MEDRMVKTLTVWHRTTFLPVCVRTCRASSSERANRLPQPIHLHRNGRSPVCSSNTTNSQHSNYIYKTFYITRSKLKML